VQSFTDFPFPATYYSTATLSLNSSALLVGMKQIKVFKLKVDENIELD